MLVLRYFLYVGVLLFVLLYGWSEYLQPSGTAPQAGMPTAAKAEVFRPTPAPPVAQGEQPPPVPSEPSVADAMPNEAANSAVKSRKQKTKSAHRRAARRSYAYAPSRRSRPFYWGWH